MKKHKKEIEQLNHNEAIKKYQPEIIICSWMPYQKDFSKDFRSQKSVKEYLLIGETDDGCCGDDWETWGCSWRLNNKSKNQIPPYENDGFKRTDLDKLSALQSCRTDQPGDYYHSKTVSFKRKD